jgi:hypothetical protein
MEMDTLWNVGLTTAIAIAGFLARSLFLEVQRLQLLLNKTREEIARDYVTKAQATNDINRILDKIDALDNKLDRIIERR